jgi:glycerate 2-kinase
MVEIINKEELLTNAKSLLDRKARKFALMGLEAALEAADPKDVVKSRIKLKGKLLRIDDSCFDLEKFRKIFVVGGGKASGSMAEAIERILSDYITGGAINIPRHSGKYGVERVLLQEASHPVPDEAGVKGAKHILNLVSQADEEDLVICLISGGGSSLMPLPRGDISLQDKQVVTEALLNSGATINEVNTVRKHISDFKGGWLAKRAYPATVINLILSDVLGDPLDFIASGPSVPDSTTFQDAIEVLERYRLWDGVPESVKKVLLDGKRGLIAETPKKDDEAFKKVYNFVVGNNRLASLAAYSKLQNAGLNMLFLTSCLEGEARHVGTVFASVTREIEATGKPFPRPVGIVVGGETTVTVVGEGIGGRNQEIALGAALKIQGLDGVAIGAISTDGIDGPTDAAGALADGKTIARSQELGLNAAERLMNNDSYTFFSKLGDLILTGPTGTNVNDVSIIVAV